MEAKKMPYKEKKNQVRKQEKLFHAIISVDHNKPIPQ